MSQTVSFESVTSTLLMEAPIALRIPTSLVLCVAEKYVDTADATGFAYNHGAARIYSAIGVLFKHAIFSHTEPRTEKVYYPNTVIIAPIVFEV